MGINTCQFCLTVVEILQLLSSILANKFKYTIRSRGTIISLFHNLNENAIGCEIDSAIINIIMV